MENLRFLPGPRRPSGLDWVLERLGWVISGLICQAATEADIDPDRVKFTRTVRIIRRAIARAAFPP